MEKYFFRIEVYNGAPSEGKNKTSLGRDANLKARFSELSSRNRIRSVSIWEEDGDGNKTNLHNVSLSTLPTRIVFES